LLRLGLEKKERIRWWLENHMAEVEIGTATSAIASSSISSFTSIASRRW
jgi:hypothetical protein